MGTQAGNPKPSFQGSAAIKARPRVPGLFSQAWAGLMTGASDDDPCGIGNYSRVGALGWNAIDESIYTVICTDNLYTCYAGFMNDRVSPSQAERASALAAELRAIFGKLKRKVREQGGQSDLRPSQVSVVLRIEKAGPSTVSSLARAEGMRPQSMSTIITSLLETGLVNGSPDPNDRRQTLMSLSRKCQNLLKDGRAARQDWLTTTIQKKLSSGEQEKLAATVNLLARLIED